MSWCGNARSACLAAGMSECYASSYQMVLRLLCSASAVAIIAGCAGNDREAASSAIGDSGRSAPPGDGGDPNGTFDSARKLTLGSFPGVLDTIEGHEDVDFFSFDGTEGQWVTIQSTGSSSVSISDTAIALYDPDRSPLAWNAYVDSFVGEQVLARIVTRLPATGTYYLSIGDQNAPPAALGLVQPYKISVVDSSTLDGYTIDAETGDDASAATPSSFHRWDIPNNPVDDAFFLGSFTSRTDVDAFSFEVKDNSRVASARIEKIGISGNGSTSLIGKAWVTDETGAVTIARIDNTVGQDAMSPPLSTGRYRLFVSHPDADPSSNDFYVVRTFLAADNPAESADSTNGTIGAAEPLVIEQGSAYLLSHVGDNDIDYFSFAGVAGGHVAAHCTSGAEGSGLIGLRVALRDENDITLVEGAETLTTPIDLAATIPASGRLFLRETKDSQLSDVIGDWSRCVVQAQ
jgi:hypothetical protein